MRLLIGTTSENGGAERVATWLAEQLSNRSHEVTLWTPQERDLSRAALRSALQGEWRAYDVVNMHHRKLELASRLAGIPRRKRRLTLHHAPVNQTWLKSGSPTSCPAQPIIDQVGWPDMTYIPNPVLNTWQKAAPSDAGVQLLYVGRIDAHQKDWRRWLVVASATSLAGHDVRADVYGWGEEGSLMREEADRLLPGRVTFHGWTDPSTLEVPANGVLLLTSRWECSPLVAVEAAASDIPVVATPVGDLPLHPGAWRVGSNNEELTAHLIDATRLRFASDPYREEAAALAASRNPEAIVSRYIAWYETAH